MSRDLEVDKYGGTKFGLYERLRKVTLGDGYYMGQKLGLEFFRNVSDEPMKV